MREKINEINQELENVAIHDLQELETFRLRFLSKNGLIPQLFVDFRTLDPSEKKELGAVINELKNKAEDIFKNTKTSLDTAENTTGPQYDPFLENTGLSAGSRHPLNLVMNEVQDIFIRAGFSMAEGPEIEDDWHNFSALNFPPDHPARDMQDTFFISGEDALRTHTSSVQIRLMEKKELPIRIIAPGRVYRNEAVSARSNCFFHQVEALYIDKDVSLADLKHLLLHFAKEFFGKDAKIRLRASYFPFTEPSAEMDVSCFLCKGEGCNVCKHTGWLEIMGCGMVDPNVLENCGIDPNVYSGYALGMGIERVAMLKYGVKDLRTFVENDVRFLKQFTPG